MHALTLLEHINLNVPNEATARAFYVDGLGGVVQPKSTNARQLHVNVGCSQFHLLLRGSVLGMEPIDHAQVWAGHIELWTSEPLERLHARLPHCSELGTDEGAVFDADAPVLRCSCPWGNRFVVRSALPSFSPAGAHPGGCGTLVAMPRLVHPLRPGAAQHLAAFWRDVLGCDAHETGGSCVVPFASGQQLVFEEHDDAPPHDAYDTAPDARAEYHLALYVPTAEAFRAAYERAEAAGLLFANPRFQGGPIEFASPMSWEEAERGGQFRVKELRGPGAADAVGLVLELEVRSPTHVSCPLERQAD